MNCWGWVKIKNQMQRLDERSPNWRLAVIKKNTAILLALVGKSRFCTPQGTRFHTEYLTRWWSRGKAACHLGTSLIYTNVAVYFVKIYDMEFRGEEEPRYEWRFSKVRYQTTQERWENIVWNEASKMHWPAKKLVVVYKQKNKDITYENLPTTCICI